MRGSQASWRSSTNDDLVRRLAHRSGGCRSARRDRASRSRSISRTSSQRIRYPLRYEADRPSARAELRPRPVAARGRHLHREPVQRPRALGRRRDRPDAAAARHGTGHRAADRRATRSSSTTSTRPRSTFATARGICATSSTATATSARRSPPTTPARATSTAGASRAWGSSSRRRGATSRRSSEVKKVYAELVREGARAALACRRMADARDRDYAELIVDDCLRVQPGWQVLVGGNPQARPLLEELCGAVARRGAYALLRVSFEGFLAQSLRWVEDGADGAFSPSRRRSSSTSSGMPMRWSSSRLPTTRVPLRRRARADGRPAGRLPARHRPDDESRRALGRLPVPDCRARAGGGARHRRVRGAALRRRAARLGGRRRADARRRGALRRRLRDPHRRRRAPICGSRSRGGR